MGNILVTHVQQTSRNWCWAACSEMFLRRYGKNNLTQAALANLHNAKFGHGLDSMATDAEVNWILKNHGGLAVERAGPLEWGALQAILNNCRLVIASALNHAWLIVGCENDPVHGQVVWVHDPARDGGPNKAKFSVFKNEWLTSVMLSQSSAEALD